MCSILKVSYRVLGVVSKAFKRKYVKKVLVSLSLDDEMDIALEVVDELRQLYKTKLKPQIDKYDVDTEKLFRKKLEGLDIDLDAMEAQQEKTKSKMGLVKLDQIFKGLDEVERVSTLKDEKLLFDVEELTKGLLTLKYRVEIHKQDYKKEIEKHLREKQPEMDEVRVALIKQEAIEEYMKTEKKKQQKVIREKRVIKK